MTTCRGRNLRDNVHERRNDALKLGEIDIVYFCFFDFGRPLSMEEIHEYLNKRNKDLNLDLRIDLEKPKAYYTFSKHYRSYHMPLVVRGLVKHIFRQQKFNLEELRAEIENLVNELPGFNLILDFTRDAWEKIERERKEISMEITKFEIRISLTGVISVRIWLRISGPKLPTTSLITLMNTYCREYARGISTYTVRMLFEGLKEWSEPADYYCVLLIGESEPEYNDVSVLKKEHGKELIGLSFSSWLWPRYNRELVEARLKNDLSYTTREIQLIEWRNTLIFSPDLKVAKEEPKMPAPYFKYISDLLLALELLLMQKMVLERCDELLDDELRRAAEILEKALTTESLSALRLYVRSLEKELFVLRRLEVEVVDALEIERGVIIDHFKSFVKAAKEELGLSDLLLSVSNKIRRLEDIENAVYEAMSRMIRRRIEDAMRLLAAASFGVAGIELISMMLTVPTWSYLPIFVAFMILGYKIVGIAERVRVFIRWLSKLLTRRRRAGG